ncbi:MAG: bile acid:sodium symporter family protein [Paludibacteraceae bacterium]|nr:bile acid:sodium symporter family protein [Paludibacteraceae bacterium]
MKKLANFLTQYTSLFIIAVAVVTMIVPELFTWVKGNTQTCILGFIMLTMGLTLSKQDFKVLAARPLDILIGTLAQFTIMPLVAYFLTRIFNLDTSLAVGIILVGCCPGGVSSNIMSYLCKGDVAFSVGMTTVSTLLAPFVTPLLVLLLAGEKVDVNAWGMFQNILIVTLIPVAIGFILNHNFGENEKFKSIKEVSPSLSVIGLALIVGGVVSTSHGPIVDKGISLLMLTLAVVFCHNTLGYILGYMIGKFFKFSTPKKRTISIEVGMQNAGLATVLANTFFMANPLCVVPCAISCAYHSISGTILANIFKRQDNKKKES